MCMARVTKETVHLVEEKEYQLALASQVRDMEYLQV